eukprot:3703226-Rhodomonas_salina.1
MPQQQQYWTSHRVGWGYHARVISEARACVDELAVLRLGAAQPILCEYRTSLKTIGSSQVVYARSGDRTAAA